MPPEQVINAGPDAAERAIATGMAARIAAFDWSTTPLGRRDRWSPTLATSVDIMLSSRFPMILWWGSELTVLYNDAYAPILADKHPGALGGPGLAVWAELSDVIGPMLHGVLDHDEATWSVDQLLVMQRRGYCEETYFTWSYSPVHEHGRVAGVFTAVTETTGTVLGARRLRLLGALTEATHGAADPLDALRRASIALDEHRLDVPVHALYLRDADGWRAVRSTGLPTGDPSDPVDPDHLLERAGDQWTVVRLADLGLPDAPSAWEEPVRDGVVVRLPGAAGLDPLGVALIGLSPRLPVDDTTLELARLIGARVASAAVDAGAAEAERRRAAALEELNRSKSAFLSSVSHEFRTPLTLILAPLEDALDDGPGVDWTRQADRLTTARANGLRLLRLVNSLLEFSRLEAGRAVASRRPHDVATLTAELASMFRSAMEAAGLRYTVDVVAPSAPVAIDGDMWETIVFNLLSNALKYTPDGEVRVALRRYAGDIELEVADTGIGVAPDDADRIFDRFYRVVDDRARSIEGAGIGLTLVRELSALHGGTVEVDSALGRGSTFRVRIPVVPAAPNIPSIGDDATPAADHPGARAEPFLDEAGRWLSQLPIGGSVARPARSRPLLLLVDDNPDMLRYLGSILADDADVVTAADGETALRVARERPPDLVVTDVMMPRVDGLEFVTRLRADERLARVPVLVVSARAGTEAVVDGLQRGADAYVVKPFTARELKARVHALLRGVDRAAEHHDALAERSADVLTALAAALNSAMDLQAVAVAVWSVVDSATPVVGATLSVRERDGLVTHQYFGSTVPGDLRARYQRTPLTADTPHTRAMRDGVPRFYADRAQLARTFPASADELARIGVEAGAALPFFDVHNRVIGCVSIGWPVARTFDAADTALLRDVAELVGHAVERVEIYEREREIARTLQLRLLNLDLRTTRAVVRARYRPADDAMEVGGDWFDAKELDDGRLMVAVGDVVGHGLAAAATMGQLRAALGALALHASDPVDAVRMLDTFAARLPEALGTTLALALLDADAESLTYCLAGHPPPVLVSPDGDIRLLAEAPSWPLGLVPDLDRRPAPAAPFPPGSLLVLYTDGLVERRGEPIDRGLERLQTAVAEHWNLPVPRLKAKVFEAVLPRDKRTDDAAIVAVRTLVANEHLFVDRIAARSELLAPLRHRLRDWLRAYAMVPRREDDVLLAVGEACANAIDHGSRGNRTATIGLEIGVRPDALVATVTDSGAWQTGIEGFLSGRGRGHTIMRALAEDVQVQSDTQGTAVTLRLRR